MKKLIPLILIVLMAFFAVSCDGNNPEPNPSADPYPTEESIAPPEAKDGPISEDKARTVSTVNRAINQLLYGEDYDPYAIDEETTSEIYDDSNNLAYKMVYSSSGTISYYLEQDIYTLKKGDVLVVDGETYTLNGNSIETFDYNSFCEALKAKSKTRKLKSYSEMTKTNLTYEGQTITISASDKSMGAETSDGSSDMKYMSIYTIEGGNIEGITYLGMYSVIKNGTYSDIVFEIKGDASIAGIYTVPEELFNIK